jgi:DNA-binding Xre family transcriptional regulator
VGVLLAEHNVKRAERGEGPLSVRGLADATGISHSSLVNIVKDTQRRVDFDVLERLMRFFGTTDMNDVLVWRDEDVPNA